MATGVLETEKSDDVLPVTYVQKYPRVPTPTFVYPKINIESIIDPQTGKIMVTHESYKAALEGCGFYAYGRGRKKLHNNKSDKQTIDVSLDVTDCFDAFSSSEESEPKRLKTNDPCHKEHSGDDHVELSPVEAFYCIHKLNCLNVYTIDNEVVDCHDLWAEYTRTNVNFIPAYAAYCYLKQNGWVVMNGIKFGVDYLVYKGSPEAYHSSYCVKVRVCVKETLSDSKSIFTPTRLDCRELAALQRVAEGTGKYLLILDVIIPHHSIAGSAGSNPACVSSFTVQEVLVKRWIAGKERTSNLE